jgi:hypothetical protein
MDAGHWGGGAFTIPVIIQYVEVRERMDTIMLSHSSPGTQNCAMVQFCFILDKVRIQRHGQSELQGVRYLWKVKGMVEFKFFFWLALQGRC